MTPQEMHEMRAKLVDRIESLKGKLNQAKKEVVTAEANLEDSLSKLAALDEKINPTKKHSKKTKTDQESSDKE